MKTLIALSLFISINSIADCEKIKIDAKALEKAWRSEIVKDIGRYGRYSKYSIKSITGSGTERRVRMIQLERECKEFIYNVSLSIQCEPEVSIKSLQSCYREK